MFYYRIGAGSYEEHHESTLMRDDEISEDQLDVMLEQAEIAVFKKLWPEVLKNHQLHLEWQRENDAKYNAENPDDEPFMREDEGPNEGYGSNFDEIIDELVSSHGFSRFKLTAEVWRGAWDQVRNIVICPHCDKEKLTGGRFDSGNPRKDLPHNCIK